MIFDKLKPNLQELNLNGVKKAASRVAHVRIRLSRGQWIGVIAGLVVVTVLLVILLRPRPAAVVLPVVAVEPVTTEDVNIYGDYVGRIRAQQFVEIRARVEGYLEKMLFAEGTYIRKGQTLFVIDPRVYRARVDKAKAQLNKARAQALKAKRDLDRIRPLFEQSAASQLELDNATAAYESAVADVAVGEADLTQAQMTLGYTSVQSPISGYISERNADIGTLVGPSGKSLLATVVKSDTVRVDGPRLPAQQGAQRQPRAPRFDPQVGSLHHRDPGRRFGIPLPRPGRFRRPAGRSADGYLLRASRDGQP